MAKPSRKQKKKIAELEEEIKEEKSLWKKIKRMPKEDKSFSQHLKEFIIPKRSKKKPRVSKVKKEKARKIFWGLEPPEKKKKLKKKTKKKNK